MKTKIIKRLGVIQLSCILTLFMLFVQDAHLSGDVPQNQCFKCHTSAKMLIEITREIAKTRPVVKSENEGEG